MDTAARVSERAPGAADREPLRAVRVALEELRRGNIVLVVDAADREDEGDLIMAAEHATAGAVAFMIRHTSGLLCVGITPERADELALPPMVTSNEDARAPRSPSPSIAGPVRRPASRPRNAR